MTSRGFKPALSATARRTDRPRLLAAEAFLAALTALAVFLSAKLAYAFAVRDFVIVWIPAGVLLGILVTLESRRWPSALLGGYVGNLIADLHTLGLTSLSVLGPIVNILESLLAATVIRLVVGRRSPLTSLRGVGALVLGAAVVSNALTAVGGGALLSLPPGWRFWHGWLHWWVGDGLGMLVVTPAILGLGQGYRRLRQNQITWKKLLEGGLLFTAVVTAGLFAFDRPAGADHFLASTYLAFPFLMVLALRRGAEASGSAVCLLAGVALWFSALGHGPLVDPDHLPLDQALHLYAFLTFASISVLVPAASIAERAEAAERVRASESRYRALVGTARDAIITVGPDGLVRFTNPAVEQIFGYEPHALVGRRVTELLPESQRAGLESAFYRHLSEGKPVSYQGVQFTAMHRDGREVPVEVAIGEWTAEGERYFTGILRDISERRQMEENLRHAQKLEALGQLTGGLAHEFRNELSVILGNAELALIESPTEGPHRSALEEIRAAGSRGASLTRELLAFARRQTLQPVALDLDDLVARSATTLRTLLGTGIVVEAEGDGRRKHVMADQTALQQVLLNLMLNARDAMPDGGRLVLRTGLAEVSGALAERLTLPPGGRYVTLEVRDSGCGMDAATMSRLFEPFFTTKPEGTGLGLAVVHGIIRQSGGAILVESEPGVGTTFQIFLPEPSEPGCTTADERGVPAGT